MIQMYFRAPATRKRCSVLGEEELPWLAEVLVEITASLSGKSEIIRVTSSSSRKLATGEWKQQSEGYEGPLAHCFQRFVATRERGGKVKRTNP